jgi:hypothetical protein
VTRPIVFCTDYGLQDGFVGVCHGVMASIAPDVRIIDLTHAIPRQDVGRGALLLSRAVPFLPPDAVVVAVVDPGVGSERRGIVVRSAQGMLLVGPDNGLLGPSWEALGGAAEAHEIASRDLMREPVSRTFHGRDVFAPVGAHLATGLPLDRVGPAIDTRVMAVDGFGNVQLNVEEEHLAAAGIAGALKIGDQTLPFVAIFADLPDQGMGAIVDSQGFLALVVNTGNASERLQLRDGDTVVLERADGEGGGPGPRHLQSVD